jgi:hypothetical protein
MRVYLQKQEPEEILRFAYDTIMKRHKRATVNKLPPCTCILYILISDLELQQQTILGYTSFTSSSIRSEWEIKNLVSWGKSSSLMTYYTVLLNASRAGQLHATILKP